MYYREVPGTTVKYPSERPYMGSSVQGSYSRNSYTECQNTRRRESRDVAPRAWRIRRVARAVAGSDASDWVRRCSAVTSATPPVHAGQCWPTGDLLVLLAGCGSKSCQYRGSRQAIPHGLQLPGELPMPPARRAITLARSQMRAPAFLCRRRADATTFSASTSCPLRYAAMIPRSQQSLPPRVSRRA